jgi:hypothetical protein
MDRPPIQLVRYFFPWKVIAAGSLLVVLLLALCGPGGTPGGPGVCTRAAVSGAVGRVPGR